MAQIEVCPVADKELIYLYPVRFVAKVKRVLKLI
jgi:hypothetical protein